MGRGRNFNTFILSACSPKASEKLYRAKKERNPLHFEKKMYLCNAKTQMRRSTAARMVELVDTQA